ncbi:MAG: ribonuclease R [Verrucomicrobia bacterium]|nr:ribonuclease R [Verrucomicrobiota bacterium]
MEEQILSLLGQKDYFPANVPEMLRLLQLSPNRQQELQVELRKLEQSGQITRTKGNRYIKSQEADLIPGQIQINRQGKGFLRPDDAGVKEIMIPENATSTALHGDRVLVRRDVRARGLRPDRGTEQETGSVIRILERKRSQIVGTLQRGRQFLYVIPDDPRMPHDIYVPEPRDVGRKPNIGDKVVVELLEWESRHNNPEGEIIEVLGAPDEEGVDMLSVLRQYNLPLHFPKPVLAEARAIGSTVTPHELAGREDCRSHQVVTIDPDDAKDFDDAICLQRISHDHWKLWVHIADVSHYVKPGTALDVEARKRGNSTYLVDRVIPMLPEALSNELCSLKPNVDRLTKSVEFLVADDGRVLSTKFYPAVIHSQRRFTYKEVFAILEERRSPHRLGSEAESKLADTEIGAPVPDSIVQMLHDAHELAQRIRRLRFKNGSLALDFPETKIRLDEQGRVLRIEKIGNDVSHQLIEEYMLLANEAVATRLMSQNQKAIYRVHEEPDERRLNEYREDVLSHHIPCGNLTKRPEVSKLLQKLDTIPIGAALKIGFLRSLMRARYAVEPLGHYGLAKAKYTHFTSPIRRYADLVVHRALFQASHGPTHSLKETAEHISDTERNSADAERDSKDVKMYAFLKAQLAMPKPPVYPALVIDVRNFGFFADVPGLAMSGLIHCSSLTDDFYEFDEARGTLTGRRNRRVFRLGDKVEVQIAKVDSFKKQVDFRLAREERDRSPVAAGEQRGSRPHFQKSQGWRSAAAGDRPRSEQQQRPPQRFQDRQQSRPQSRPQPGQPPRGPSRPPQQKSGKFKSQSQPRPPLPSRSSRDAKSQPARPQSGGGNFRAGPARPQIPSSHSRSKFGGRRRR